MMKKKCEFSLCTLDKKKILIEGEHGIGLFVISVRLHGREAASPRVKWMGQKDLANYEFKILLVHALKHDKHIYGSIAYADHLEIHKSEASKRKSKHRMITHLKCV